MRTVARNKLIENLRRRGNRTDLRIEDFADSLPAEPEDRLLTARFRSVRSSSAFLALDLLERETFGFRNNPHGKNKRRNCN